MKLLNQLWEALLCSIYPAPAMCPLCSKKIGTDSIICTGCQSLQKQWAKMSFCHFCGRLKVSGVHCQCSAETTYYRNLSAVAPYTGDFKKAAHRLKYSGQTHLALPLGKLIGKHLRESNYPESAIIIPAPLAARKLAQRGFNQSLLLAAAAGKETGQTVLDNILIKCNDTPPQASLKRAKRKQNLQGVFKVQAPEAILDQSVILLDDIFTTGATVNEMARVLLEAGAGEVTAIVWAMGVPDAFSSRF